MESEKCRAVLCAIDCGTITEAADKLHYTISGISKMVAALEAETGFPLLVRTKKGVSPTDECSRLVPLMREIVRLAEDYSQTAREIQGIHTGRVVFATSYHCFFSLFAKIIADFSERYPGIEIELLSGTSSALCEQVAEGAVDLCFVSRRETAVDFIALATDELLAWLPAAYWKPGLKRFPVQRLGDVPYIDIFPNEETDNSRMLRQHGIHPKSAYRTSDINAAFSMVEAGLGVAVINKRLAKRFRGNVLALPLDPPQKIEIGLASKKSLSPAARRFKDFLLQCCAKQNSIAP